MLLANASTNAYEAMVDGLHHDERRAFLPLPPLTTVLERCHATYAAAPQNSESAQQYAAAWMAQSERAEAFGGREKALAQEYAITALGAIAVALPDVLATAEENPNLPKMRIAQYAEQAQSSWLRQRKSPRELYQYGEEAGRALVGIASVAYAEDVPFQLHSGDPKVAFIVEALLHDQGYLATDPGIVRVRYARLMQAARRLPRGAMYSLPSGIWKTQRDVLLS